MTTDLRERLHDLAGDAPTGHLVGADVWRFGVRRHRLRVAAGAAGAAAAVALVAGLVTVVPTAQPPDPAASGSRASSGRPTPGRNRPAPPARSPPSVPRCTALPTG
jgi:hypothetical protein